MPKGFRKNRVRRPRRSTKPKMSFSKRVLSVVNKQRELKVGSPVTHFITDVREGITNGNRATNQLQILSSIPQGVNESERIGNSITLKKIVMRGYYRLQFPIGTHLNSRVLLRTLIMRQRSQGNASLILNGSQLMNYNNLLEPSAPYTGAVSDFNVPINSDAFIVKKQWKKILTAEVSNVWGDPDMVPALGTEGTYHFFNYTMTFGKGKNLNYRTGGAIDPEDFPYFLAHSASNLGSNAALGGSLVGFNLTCTPYFYDV